VLEPVGALSIIQKTRTSNWGLDGGEPGKKNVVVLDSNEDDFDERIEVLVDNDHLHDGDGKHVGMFRGDFAPGEIISNRTAGGGGYGNPYDRDPERVLEDYRDGYVTREAAYDQYGVAISDNGRIDHEETAALREDQ
jgi:N-methylhydantoinase B